MLTPILVKRWTIQYSSLFSAPGPGCLRKVDVQQLLLEDYHRSVRDADHSRHLLEEEKDILQDRKPPAKRPDPEADPWNNILNLL